MTATILVCDDDSAIRTVLNQARSVAGDDGQLHAGSGQHLETVAVERIEGFDLFPNTQHIECVATFTRG